MNLVHPNYFGVTFGLYMDLLRVAGFDYTVDLTAVLERDHVGTRVDAR